MACIGPDGELTASARAILRELEEPRVVFEIAGRAGQPIFLVRRGLRELLEEGLVEELEAGYVLTCQSHPKGSGPLAISYDVHGGMGR